MPYTVVPPYLLNKIIANGSRHQRDHARRTLMHVQHLMAEHFPHSAAQHATVSDRVRREIYDAQNTESLPGKLIRTENDPGTQDIAAQEAWDYLGVTWDFFRQSYQRNSLDDAGLALRGTVHYGTEYQNAFWNGQQMVFGDGDGEIFNRFTIAVDIVAHELAHGITESEANLIYFEQAGALNESVSDVFGALVKQFYLRQTADQADWLIGEGLLAAGINGRALRSMAEPGSAYDDPMLGRDPQPGHMDHYIETREDNGGVHLNSGIPNRAFYLAATALGGYAWELAGHVWYDTLCDKALPQDADFNTFAAFTVRHARQRFNTSVSQTIADAWRQVGVEP